MRIILRGRHARMGLNVNVNLCLDVWLPQGLLNV